MTSKLFCLAVLLAGCKEKAADPPPAKPLPVEPAPDPSPAARSGKPTEEPAAAGSNEGSGSDAGSATGKRPSPREVAKRVGVDLATNPDLAADPKRQRSQPKK